MADIYNDTDIAERVCSLISADENTFTYDRVASFDFLGMAEIAVKKAVPIWENILNGEDENRKELLRACVVYQTAILLAPNAKKEQVKLQQTTHAKVEFFESSAYDLLIEGLYERLSFLELELNGEDYNGFSSIAITNADKRYNGSGFDAP